MESIQENRSSTHGIQGMNDWLENIQNSVHKL